MAFEAEVIPMFIGGVCVVSIFELIAGCILLRKHKSLIALLVGHVVSMAVSMTFLIRCLFAKWIGIYYPDSMLSENNSVNVGFFGVFWALSVVLLVALIGILVHKLNKSK